MHSLYCSEFVRRLIYYIQYGSRDNMFVIYCRKKGHYQFSRNTPRVTIMSTSNTRPVGENRVSESPGIIAQWKSGITMINLFVRPDG